MNLGLNDILNNINAKDTEGHEATVVAQEAITTEQEREFCMWANVSYDEQARLTEEVGGLIYVDFLLRSDDQRRRVRIDCDTMTAQYTVKLINEDGSRTEENTDLSLQAALLFHHDAKTIHVCYRVKAPCELENSKGWDIDLFVRNIGHTKDVFKSVSAFKAFIEDIKQNAAFMALTKIELEVESNFEGGMTLSRLNELSPVKTEEFWASTDQTPEIRNMLDNFWNYESDF